MARQRAWLQTGRAVLPSNTYQAPVRQGVEISPDAPAVGSGVDLGRVALLGL